MAGIELLNSDANCKLDTETVPLFGNVDTLGQIGEIACSFIRHREKIERMISVINDSKLLEQIKLITAIDYPIKC
jgi:hypothetical protein